MEVPRLTPEERARIHARMRLWTEAESGDSSRFRDMSPEERGRWVAVACRDAMAVLAAQPDASTTLAARDPIPAESLELWRRLRREYADARRT